MRFLTGVAAVAFLAGCFGAAGVRRPFHSTSAFDGLQQEISVTPGRADEKVFSLSSRLINRGPEPVTVRVVTCYLGREHLRTRGTLVPRAVPGCPRTQNRITLAPGDTSESVGFFGQFNRPGRYAIRVRHALEPEFWGEIRVVAR